MHTRTTSHTLTWVYIHVQAYVHKSLCILYINIYVYIHINFYACPCVCAHVCVSITTVRIAHFTKYIPDIQLYEINFKILLICCLVIHSRYKQSPLKRSLEVLEASDDGSIRNVQWTADHRQKDVWFLRLRWKRLKDDITQDLLNHRDFCYVYVSLQLNISILSLWSTFYSIDLWVAQTET